MIALKDESVMKQVENFMFSLIDVSSVVYRLKLWERRPRLWEVGSKTALNFGFKFLRCGINYLVCMCFKLSLSGTPHMNLRN